MHRIIKITATFSFSFTSFAFIFIPDDLWLLIKYGNIINDCWISIINRILAFIIILVIIFIFVLIILTTKKKYVIKDKNFLVEVRYEDLLKTKRGLHVINFDECFTTKIGEKSGDIKESSICGQFLLNNNDLNIDKILELNGIKPETRKSKYLKKSCYKPGTIVPYNDSLLMAFAKLDENGIAKFDSIEDYMLCLSYLWKQLTINHGDSNVCIPILGSGKTNFHGRNLSQQEILDLMIFSYKISDNRLKKPYRLIICCKKSDDFSLYKIKTSL